LDLTVNTYSPPAVVITVAVSVCGTARVDRDHAVTGGVDLNKPSKIVVVGLG